MAKILVTDDEPDIRELVAFTLRFAGHEVITATNGEEAYTTALQEMPDLILMDVRMPRMTGYEACEKMKADARIAHIPVVFLSAKGQEAEIQTGLNLGATEYLLKPFAPDDLVKRIDQILQTNSGQ
ncbi:MAG: response regulator [Anaerolineae bacterium]|nr:response regulator [Anaerolineae bacterium]